MEFINEVKVKQFNYLLKAGTPIQLTFTRDGARPYTITGLIKHNEGDHLVYVHCVGSMVKEQKLYPEDINLYGIEIKIGKF
jgi:hypothetical protein